MTKVLLAKLDQEHAAVGQAFAPFDLLTWKNACTESAL